MKCRGRDESKESRPRLAAIWVVGAASPPLLQIAYRMHRIPPPFDFL